MTIVLTIIGALVGAALGEVAGLLGGGLLGLLAARLIVQQGRQQRLAGELARLAARIDALEGAPPATPRSSPAAEITPPPAPGVAASGPAPAASWTPQPPAASATTPPQAPSTSPSTSTVRPAAPGRLTRVGARLLRFFTTGNVLARVGVVVLFFGVAFLVRLAAERGLVPIELRLVAVALGALAMIAFGWRLRGRRRDYALVLQGGGVGLLYLTVFGAARLYALVPLGLAFALMVVLVVVAGALAVVQNAPALAAFGVTGGFLAPVLSATGSGSHVALFSYYALLNAGILGVAWFRAWRVLNLLGFVFTWAIGSLWGARYYAPGYFASVEPFVVLSFLFYLALPVLFATRGAPRLRGVVDGTLVFGNPVVFFTVQNQLVAELPFGRAISALAMGAVYALLARALWRRDAQHLAMLVEAFVALAALFATLAIPFALDGHWTAAAWSLEGAGVLWVGLRQRRRLAQLAGLALQLAAAGVFFFDAPLTWQGTSAQHATALGAALIALAALFSAWRLERDSAVAWPWMARSIPLLLAWAIAWWCGALVHEIDQLFAPRHFLAAVVVALAVSALALAWLARRLDFALAALPPAGMMPLGLCAVLLGVTLEPSAAPWHDGGWLAWPLLVMVGGVLMARYAAAWPPLLRDGVHASLLYLLVALATWLVAHLLARQALLGEAWVMAGCGGVAALVLLGLSHAGAARRWPVRVSARAWQHLGLVPLIVILAGWLALNATRAGGPAPLPYVPLLNPLDLVAVLGLVAALAWWRRLRRDGVLTSTLARAARVAFAIAAFAVLNTVVLRVMHHHFMVPWRLSALWHDPGAQAALSLTWALVGSVAMAFAARGKRARERWLAGAALMGVVVVKLFVVDLAGSGAVARVVSFIGVGVVCLAIAYLAPIPPRSPAREEP